MKVRRFSPFLFSVIYIIYMLPVQQILALLLYQDFNFIAVVASGHRVIRICLIFVQFN